MHDAGKVRAQRHISSNPSVQLFASRTPPYISVDRRGHRLRRAGYSLTPGPEGVSRPLTQVTSAMHRSTRGCTLFVGSWQNILQRCCELLLESRGQKATPDQ